MARGEEGFMNSEVMKQIKQIIDAKAQAQPTPMEFELAYQARVAMIESGLQSNIASSSGHRLSKCRKLVSSYSTHWKGWSLQSANFRVAPGHLLSEYLVGKQSL